MTDEKLVTIIFSKDRALQLEALLRSYILHYSDTIHNEIDILYTFSENRYKKDYEKLKKEFEIYEFINFKKENNFKDDLVTSIESYEYILFLVDDVIFLKDFSVNKGINALRNNNECIGFSMRLGFNTKYCYMLDKFQRIPEHQKNDDLFAFNWTAADHDFGYPLEVSTSIYRIGDLLPHLKAGSYKNPNSLEDFLSTNRAVICGGKYLTISYIETKAVGVPYNLVQNVAPGNRKSGKLDFSVEELSDLYRSGKRIDIEYFNNYQPISVHEEIDFITLEKTFTSNDNVASLSIVMPVYNQEEFIAEAIESVMKQTSNDWELIIVNDGSTDSSLKIAKEFLENHKNLNIKVISKKNKGLSAARNTGILHSKGKYILPLDSDDKLKPDTVNRYLELVKEIDADIIYPDYTSFGAQNEYVECIDENLFNDPNRALNGLPYCTFYKREVWVKNRGYKTNMLWGFEDWEYWISSLKNGFKAYHLKEARFDYRVKSESMLTDALKFERVLRLQIVLNNIQLFGINNLKEVFNLISEAPIVSVIIPTYNRPKELANAINSVKSQTFGIFEIIVVNDNGEDVEGIIKSFDDKRIKYFKHDKNKGLASTRNTGIKKAKGKYICFLDDDDQLLSNYLEQSLKLARKNPIIYTDAYRYSYKKNNKDYELVKVDVPYSIDYSRDKLLIGNLAPVSCYFFEIKIFDEFEGFDENLKVLEDWELLLRITEKYKLIHFPIVTNIINWVEDGTTMTSSKGEVFEKTRNKLYSKYKDEINLISNKEEIIKEFNSIWGNDFDSNEVGLSVIVPVYNQIDYTIKFLESLQYSSQFELTIINNNSTDNTSEFLNTIQKKSSDIKVISNKNNLGFPKAINQGLNISDSKYILIANNDIIVTPGAIERMIEVAESDPKIGIVGPVSNAVSGVQLDKNAKYDSIEDMFKYAEIVKKENTGQIQEFPRVAFLFTLIKKEVIEKIGGLDERFSPGNYEDDDFCLRAQLAGYKTVIAKDIFIHHFGSKSFKADGDQKYQERLDKNRIIFEDKWGANPDQIWLQGNEFKKRSIQYPVKGNIGEVYFNRTQIFIQDQDYKAAINELNECIKYIEDNPVTNLDISKLTDLKSKLQSILK